MTTAQVVFSVALAGIAVLITAFALYVVSSTFWADRWMRKPERRHPESRSHP